MSPVLLIGFAVHVFRELSLAGWWLFANGRKYQSRCSVRESIFYVNKSKVPRQNTKLNHVINLDEKSRSSLFISLLK